VIITTFTAGTIRALFNGLRSWHSPRAIYGDRV
jgi:hypothetical protein